MFCPKCGAEFVDGITICSDCKVPLVSELPLETKPEFVKLVTVLKSYDRTTIMLTKSILESNNITLYVKGEVLDKIYAIDSIAAPTEIQVREPDVEKAKELLTEFLNKS